MPSNEEPKRLFDLATIPYQPNPERRAAIAYHNTAKVGEVAIVKTVEAVVLEEHQLAPEKAQEDGAL